ncbi:AAA family ATPase [Coprobacillaceae bacterium CR2/5/TPMF4]|nr:AAA family ATPase [Coprobacillaceae bacterium CR2/5/TPMF4]
MDKESGADAIEGITYEDVYSWDEFEEFKDEIIENRSTDYKDLKVIVIDTYDGFIDLAEV